MKGHRYWVAVVFFMLAAAPGFWLPALSNVLESYGLGQWKLWVFCVPPIAGMVSPLIFGAQVDQRLQAQKVLGWIMILGALFLFGAFYAIEQEWGGGWFFGLFVVHALLSAPTWSLITLITLSSLPNSEKSFGLFRVWGTIGWMLAGVAVSVLALDFSAKTGQIGAGLRLVAGVICFLLPVTLPKGVATKKWSERLGFGAGRLLRDRDLAVFFMTSFLFAIPLSAFYMHTPVHLKELGVSKVSALMASGQLVETFAMLVMGAVIGRYRVKVILLVAIGAGVLRYAFYAMDEVGWLVVGILMHGICWTFFFEAGKIFVHRRVKAGMQGQAQALLGFFTSALGGLSGIVVTHSVHAAIVPEQGWTPYWLFLTAINVVAMILFTLGYRGVPVTVSRPS